MNRDDGAEGCSAIIMLIVSLLLSAMLFNSSGNRTKMNKAKYNDIISSVDSNVSIVIASWRLENIILPQDITCEPLSKDKVRISGPKQLVADIFAESNEH